MSVIPTLPVEVQEKHLITVKEEIQKRWEKAKSQKLAFTPYMKKPDQEIFSEFNGLNSFRKKLWYRNPEEYPCICQEDYMIAQDLLEKGYYRSIKNIAFAYNRTDSSYNASTVLINGFHFVALQEPTINTLELFFKFLINHRISVLVRLKAENEFNPKDSVKYWINNLKNRDQQEYLSLVITEGRLPTNPHYIPYFRTNSWADDQGISVKELYELVQNVRSVYKKIDKKEPIACHCASGVGRTGTFIAAFVLADMLEDLLLPEKISIEEIVLKLSIQRPYLVGTPEQYLTLYRFVDYYLEYLSRDKEFCRIG